MLQVEPTFKLKAANKNGLSLISLYAFYQNKRFVYSTGLKIDPDNWDGENHRAKTGFKGKADLNKKNTVINNKLERYSSHFKRVVDNLAFNKQTIDNKVLKAEMDKEFNTYFNVVSSDFYKFTEDYISRAGATKVSKTISGYKTTLEHIRKFDSTRHIKTSFDKINQDWYLDYTQYLKDQKQTPNTVGKHQKNFIVLLNAAKDRGITINQGVSSTRFRIIKEKTEKIALTEPEIHQLANHDLNNSKKLTQVRDLFIIAAYTALRFADFSDLKRANIQSNPTGEYIRIKQWKTNNFVDIPLHPMVKDVLEKYDYNLPSISNQKFNQYIKEAAKIAGLSREVIIRETKGSLTTDKVYRVYNKISSHTGRRSGATNMYKAGIPEHTIMKITGHKTMQAFEAYLCLDDNDHLKIMQENTFFNPSQSLKAV